jgi:hypothetical protein
MDDFGVETSDLLRTYLSVYPLERNDNLTTQQKEPKLIFHWQLDRQAKRSVRFV